MLKEQPHIDHIIPSPTSEAWARICRRLRAELGEDVFSSWFGRLELDRLAEPTAHLSVPTKFLKSWIQSHYTDRLIAAIGVEFPGVKQMVIDVRSSSRPAAGRSGRPADYLHAIPNEGLAGAPEGTAPRIADPRPREAYASEAHKTPASFAHDAKEA